MEHNFDTGETTQEPPNAEDIEIEFENQSGRIKYKLFYRHNVWLIIRWVKNYERYSSEVARFDNLRDAEETVNIIKRSV